MAAGNGLARVGGTTLARVLISVVALVASLIGPIGTDRALADGTAQERGTHTKIVRENPANNIPYVEGAVAPPRTNYVTGIAEVGNTVVVTGRFSSVRNPGSGTSIPRNNIFAFDKTTGIVNSTFVPSVNGTIDALAIAPDGQSVFIVGGFSTVNGQSRFGLAKLNVSNGQLSSGWTTTTQGRVRDAKVVGNRLFLGGDFWNVGGVARDRLAIVNATTGAVESFNQPITLDRTGGYAWVVSIDVSPDGSQMLAAGNFREVNGQTRHQIAMFDTNAGTLLPWTTQAYNATCSGSFWTYMRDVEFAPDSSYFAVATTGGPRPPSLCDTAARWENVPTTVNAQPTWADWSGGDTLTAVAVTPKAVYVGGHNRWMNNHLGRDSALIGAVNRPGVSALDPLNGVPLSWNPTRDRGSVVYSLHGTDDGLYIGADTDWVNSQLKGKLAFWPFPVVGGLVPDPTPVNFPVTVFESRANGSLTSASYNGTTAGSPVVVPGTGMDWSQADGTTLEAGYVYYTRSSTDQLYRRSFDGTTFGSEQNLFTGVYVGAQPLLVNVTAMTWDNGFLYYTRSGQTALYWRGVSLESGIVESRDITIADQGSDGFQATGTTGMEVIGNHLYFTRTDERLYRVQWNKGPVDGTRQVVSGPGIDGRAWNGRDLFAAFSGNNPPTVSVTAPSNGATVSGTVAVTANAADTDGTVASVEFFAGATSLGTDTTAPYSVNWNTTTATNGPVAITARATDNQGATTTSTAVNVTVNNVAANQPPTVSVTAPSNGATVAGTVAVTANAADTDGTVASVQFFAGATSLGTDTTAPYSVNWNTTTATNGPVAITARATDNQGATTTSTAVNVTVNNGGAGGTADILYVVGDPAAMIDGDNAVVSQLRGAGHTVTLADDSTAVNADANGMDLIIVSSSINTATLGTTFTTSAVPVLVAKPWALPNFGLTPSGGNNYNSSQEAFITITTPAHATAAGLSGNVPFDDGNIRFSWGNPAASATVVATTGGNATIFQVAAGAQLANGTTAAACRLHFPIFSNEPVDYNTNAWNLFHASINWGLNNCTAGGPPTNQAPTVSVTAPSNGATVSGTVAVTANAADTDGSVASVQFFAGATSLGTDTTAPYSVNWNTTTATNGPVAITARATDNQGATTTSTAVNVTVNNAGAQNPPIGDEADRVVVISIDGLRSDSITTLGSAGAPALHQMMSEGAFTLNARTVFEATQTMPDHASMFTGRQVALPGGHGVTFNEDNGQTIHIAAGSYVQSMFDVVHDAGGATTFRSGKDKLVFFDRSWNGTNGAVDAVGTDDGRDKIDLYALLSGANATSALITELESSPAELSVLHLAGPDGAGHASGFESAAYLAAVTEADAFIGDVLDAIENDPSLDGSTVVIVTTDHGGSGTDHPDATVQAHYTIPFFVWGAGLPAGDLYAMNPTTRSNPGTGRPNYTGTQPVRNADTANLVMDLLGLPSVTGSTINNAQNLKFSAVANTPPTVSVTAPSNGATVSGTVAVTANAADTDGSVASVQFFAGATSLGTDTTAPYSVNWNTTTATNGPVAITARATDNQGATTTSTAVNVTVSNGGAGTGAILFVVGDPAALTGGDIAVRDQLLTMGHTITIVDDNAAVLADATGKDLILVSSSINSGTLGNLYAPVAVPVLVAKPYSFDDYGLTAAPTSNYGNSIVPSLAITDPSHPTAAGFSGNIAFKSGNTNATWGLAAASAQVVATAGGNPTIFSIITGNQLATGQPAPACRLTFPIFNEQPVSYNADAWTMFHASIAWGIANCESTGG